MVEMPHVSYLATDRSRSCPLQDKAAASQAEGVGEVVWCFSLSHSRSRRGRPSTCDVARRSLSGTPSSSFDVERVQGKGKVRL